MIRTLIAVSAALLNIQVYAVEPMDYAWGIPLKTDGSKPVYRVALPEGVYRDSARNDLSDMQVFNAAGEAVPWLLQSPESAKQQQRRLDLSFYPIPSPVTDPPQAGDVRIELDRNGRIRTIIADGVETDPEQEHAYIIDISSLESAIQQLEFEAGDDETTFVQPFTLEASHDLNQWRPIIEHAALTRLQHDGQNLERMTVPLPEQPADYLRLRWLTGPGLVLERISAIATSHAAVVAERERRWMQVNATQNADADNRYLYDLGTALPVDRFNLVLPDNNTLARTTFRSRLRENDDWRLDVKARVYQLQIDGLHIANEDIAVSRHMRRYHSVEMINAGTLRTAPQLRVGWIAHELVFLARGEGPFLLAFGQAPGSSTSQPQTGLIKEDLPETPAIIGHAEAGEPRVLGGEARLQPDSGINWRLATLWSLLVLAVLALAYMATQLVREMRRKSDQTGRR